MQNHRKSDIRGVLGGGIFVDDSGTPGARSRSNLLHTQRKSWAAVIVPDSQAVEVAEALRIFVQGVAHDYSAEELHFTDIYSGRRTFKGLDPSERFELIDLMAALVEKWDLPIFFQTSSPEFMRETRPRLVALLGAQATVGPLNLYNHEHFSLMFVLIQVRRFMKDNASHFPGPLPIIVDNGVLKAGAIVQIPAWADELTGGQIEFRSSSETPFLQIADFAAFCIGRCQWLLAKSSLSPQDEMFLKMISADRLNIVNLPKVPVRPDHSGADYDTYLRSDRVAKGLPPEPPSET